VTHLVCVEEHYLALYSFSYQVIRSGDLGEEKVVLGVVYQVVFLSFPLPCVCP